MESDIPRRFWPEPPRRPEARERRPSQIGAIGTTARVVLGLALLVVGVLGGQVSVIHGQVRTGFEPLPVAVGMVAFPAVLLAWQWLRARIAPARLEATGPVSTALNMNVLIALLLTPWYATTPLLHQRRGARLLRGCHVAGSAAGLQRMRSVGNLQLDSR